MLQGFVFDKAKVGIMSDSASVTTQKTALRRSLRAQRNALSADELIQRNRAISTHVSHFCRAHAPRMVSAYVPMTQEPGGALLIDALLPTTPALLLPIVAPERQLRWAHHDGTWQEGPWGILQPASPSHDSSILHDVDIAFIPAQAVDKKGYRLGQGGGYYDRALATARPQFVIAVIFHEEFITTDIPTNAFDQPVDAVVTPKGLFGTK